MPGFFVTIQNDISRLCETVGSANSYEYMKIIEKFVYRRYHEKHRNFDWRDGLVNKQQIYDYLRQENIWYEVTEHEAVYNMAELSNIEIPYPECDAKNLFVRDDKKRNYYLITVKGDKRVDLKEFRKNNNTRALSFASADDLMDLMGLIPGAVTPLGLLNDSECKVTLFLDNDFMNDADLIGVHPNDNTATVWLKAKDLMNLIQKHGNTVNTIQI